MTAPAWAILAAYATPVLVIAACVLIMRRLARRRDRPGRALTRRERAQWRHITRVLADDDELEGPRGLRTRLGQDGSEDPR